MSSNAHRLVHKQTHRNQTFTTASADNRTWIRRLLKRLRLFIIKYDNDYDKKYICFKKKISSQISSAVSAHKNIYIPNITQHIISLIRCVRLAFSHYVWSGLLFELIFQIIKLAYYFYCSFSIPHHCCSLG